MAKEKKSKEEKVTLERVYNVPLRKEWLKTPPYKRAKKAVIALKEFMQRHMKSENILIGKFANLKIWEHGIKNPPHHIQVKAVKFEDNHVFVELDAKPKEKVPSVLVKARAKYEKRPKKEEAPATPEQAEIKELEAKEKEIKAEQAVKAQEIQKEEVKELKKEKPKLKPAKIPKEEKHEIAHQQAPAGH
jgi:large subunit ribosomal protein L31e